MTVLDETIVENGTRSIGTKLAGKYLTFKLNTEDYGIEILTVQEIIQMQQITKVPKVADYIRGVINLRGKVIPVVELRKKFGQESCEDTEETCIIVVQVETDDRPITMGIIIDAVKEVLQIEANQIEETPSLGANIDTDFITGMGKVGDEVKILLDIDKVLSVREIASVPGL